MRGYTPKEAIPTCCYNDAVYCKYKEKPCSTCGWNPEVKKARLDKIRGNPGGSKNHRK